MPAVSAMRTDMLDVPGGRVYYEVRGSGPVLLLMPGGPADATTFRRIEQTLAEDHTVVTYDPRGISHSSPLDPRDDDRMVEVFADDVQRLLAHLRGGDKAAVLASSGGAVIALELAIRHPGQLDTVIFHEPPCPDFLAAPETVRASMEDVCDTCATAGVWAAAAKFMKLVGIEGGPPPQVAGEPTPEALEAMALMEKNMEFFFSRYIRNIARYRPDLAALKACSCRLVPAVGAESTGQLAHEGGLGMARVLGVEPAVFPGDHGGFDGRPDEFAARLSEVLAR